MAAANSNIQLAELDFADIKQSIIDYLKSQDTFKDYNFAGSGLSVLLDILAYNTQYNAYYLNMVSNEMFLDTALQRNSINSHAKELGYTPQSAIGPTATINIVVNDITSSSVTLPKYTNFISQAIDGVNYNFVALDSSTVNVSGNTATFSDIEIKQGTASNYSFNVDTTSNPKLLFEIPDSNIDTTTLYVTVQNSGTDTTTTVYNLSDSYLSLDGTTTAYFLQAGLNGNYEIQFGDGIVGKTLIDGNIVRVSYVSTNGTAAAGANNFLLVDSVSGFTNYTIYPVVAANQGSEVESLSSIKYNAPKNYASQGRAEIGRAHV